MTNTQLATQDKKIKIYYRDESIKVYHNVELYQIALYSDNTLQSLKVIYNNEDYDRQIDLIKNGRNITNYKGEWEVDGQIERATYIKPYWDFTTFSSDNIIRIDFEGDMVWEKPEKEGE